MNWTTDDYLDVEENDLEWFESNPDRILRRRTAFPLEGDLLVLQIYNGESYPPSETIWVLVLRQAPFTRLYYIDPEDFHDYGEPAVNDDYALMQMWGKMTGVDYRYQSAELYQSRNGQLYLMKPDTSIDLRYLLGFKAAMIAYRKHQRATLTLQ